MINVFQPSLGKEELDAVEKVFQSNWIGKGPKTAGFEERFAEHLKVPESLVQSINCCTEGLFQSMEMLGISAGDEVVLPSISFVGAANAIMASGAKPVFCDVDPRTLNPAVSHIKEKLTTNTKAVIILHYGGVPGDMDGICALLSEKSVPLIEDSACSVASTYRGKACGTFGHLGIWSFDAMKILVTGDGGMIYCNTPALSERLEKNLYLGLMQKSGYSSRAEEKWWAFDVENSSRRAIMNDVASAIGLVQLEKLSAFIERRRAIQGVYDRELADLEWLRLPPAIPEFVESSYYLYWVQAASETRDQLAHFLRENGVYTTFRYYPLHLVSYYNADTTLPNAELAGETTLCLPIHQSLSEVDMEKIIDCIKSFGRQRGC